MLERKNQLGLLNFFFKVHGDIGCLFKIKAIPRISHLCKIKCAMFYNCEVIQTIFIKISQQVN